MKSIELDLIALLQHEKAVTIMKLEDGWMVSFAAVHQDDTELIFVPERMIVTEEDLAYALSALRQYQQLDIVKGLHA